MKGCAFGINRCLIVAPQRIQGVNVDIFQSDPKITVTFEHAFISASLTLRVQADSYPLAVPLDQDSSELLHAIFCEAVEKSAAHVAKTVAGSHAEFQKAFADAVGVVRCRS